MIDIKNTGLLNMGQKKRALYRADVMTRCEGAKHGKQLQFSDA